MSRFLGVSGGGRRSSGGHSMVDDVLPLKHKSSFTLAKDKRQMQESLQSFQQPSKLTSSAEPAPKMLQGLVISSIPLTGTDYQDSLDVASSYGDGSSYGSSYYRPTPSRNSRHRHKNKNNDSRSSWRNGGSGGRNQKSEGGNISEVMTSNKQKNNQSQKSKPKVPMLDLDTRPSVRVVPISHTQRNMGEERDQAALEIYRHHDDKQGRSSSKRTGATAAAAAVSVAGALSARRLLGKGNRSLHSKKRNKKLSKQQHQKQSKRPSEIAFDANGTTKENASADIRDMPDQQPQPPPVKVLEERVELVAMEDPVGTPFIRILMSKTTTTTTATAPSSNQNTINKLPKLQPPTKGKKQFGKKRTKSVKSASIPSKVAVPTAAAAASVVASARSTKRNSKESSALYADGVDGRAKIVASTTTKRSILPKKFSANAIPKILPSRKKTDKSETEAVAAVSATTTEKETFQLPQIIAAGEEPTTLEPTEGNRPPAVAVTSPIVKSSANNSAATTIPQQQLQLLKSQRTESLKVAINEEKQILVAKKQHEKLMQKRLKQQKKQETLELKLRKKIEREEAKRLKKQQQLLQKKEKVAAKFKAAMAKNGESTDRSVAAATKAAAAEESVTDKVKVMTLVLPCASTECGSTMADREVVDTPNEGVVSSVSESADETQEGVDGHDLEATTTYSVSTGAFETDIDEVASVKSTRLDRFVDNVIRSFTNNPEDENEESDENDVDDEDGEFTVNEELREVDVVQNRRGLIMSPNASRMEVSDEVIMGHTNTWASALGWNAQDNSYGRGEDDVRDLRMVDSDQDDRDVRILDSRDDDDDDDEDEEDFDDESESDSSGWSYDEEDHHTANGDGISYDDEDEEEEDESWNGILFDEISPRKSGGGGSRMQQRASTASKQPVDDNTSLHRAMKKFCGHAQKLGVTERDLFEAVSHQSGEGGTGGDTISKTKSQETTTSATTSTVGVVRREDFFSDDFMRSQIRRGYV